VPAKLYQEQATGVFVGRSSIVADVGVSFPKFRCIVGMRRGRERLAI
jgi:hypothetical protein